MEAVRDGSGVGSHVPEREARSNSKAVMKCELEKELLDSCVVRNGFVDMGICQVG